MWQTEIYPIQLCSHRGHSGNPSDCDQKFVLRSRRPCSCEVHSLVIYGDSVVKFCHCLRFLSFLKRRVSSYFQRNSGVPGLILLVPGSTSALALPHFLLPFCTCILLAIVLVQLVKLIFWEQQSNLKWLMFNKHKRLFHSSRVKFPFVNMSASWCLVLTYLCWLLGPD